MAGSKSSQEILNAVYDDTSKALKTGVALSGDIEIGAVEIKNSTDDTRATVGANGLYVDVKASALPSGAATEATLATIDADTSSLAGCVGGTELQVDVVSMPSVTVESEFPAAAALTDDFANPTTTNVAAMGMAWDGATWDRMPGNATDGLKVNLGADNDVTLATLPAGTNLIGEVDTKPIEPLNVNTSAYASSLVVKASAGTANEIRGHNSLASAQFIQIHDASSLPADSAVPEDIILAAANSSFSITYPQGKAFATGIVACNSSTGPTKTIGAADCWFSAEFI